MIDSELKEEKKSKEREDKKEEESEDSKLEIINHKLYDLNQKEYLLTLKSLTN